MNVGGDAAAVVRHRHGTIGVERDRHRVTVARERLVNGVVGNLEHHMMQARSVLGVADVHARPFADGVKPLQDLDRIGAVFAGGRVAAHDFLKVCSGDRLTPLYR